MDLPPSDGAPDRVLIDVDLRRYLDLLETSERLPERVLLDVYLGRDANVLAVQRRQLSLELARVQIGLNLDFEVADLGQLSLELGGEARGIRDYAGLRTDTLPTFFWPGISPRSPRYLGCRPQNRGWRNDLFMPDDEQLHTATDEGPPR